MKTHLEIFATLLSIAALAGCAGGDDADDAADEDATPEQVEVETPAPARVAPQTMSVIRNVGG